MKRRTFLKSIGLASIGAISTCCHFHRPKQPNIILFLVDDLGWQDLGCYGSNLYETPNIDRFARQGLQFMQSYSASAVCSPTRASILTGKHPARLHLTDWIGPDEWRPKGRLSTPSFVQQLIHQEKTIAETLKENGYHTCIIGKWHLGNKEYYPRYHGFDINIAGNSAGAPPSYFYPYERPDWENTEWASKLNNLPGGKLNEYLTDRLTDEALNYIESQKEGPFFLMMSHYAVHKPFQAKDSLVQKYNSKVSQKFPGSVKTFIKEKNKAYTRIVQNHPVYAAMVQSVDESFGRIMELLERLKLSDDTIIIFSSDNGGLSTAGLVSEGGWLERNQIVTSNLPLRGGKGWYYEGGIRVPTIISWPGRIEGARVSNEVIMSTDFYPTLLELAGIDLIPDQHLDGVSLADHLIAHNPLNRKTLFWHYPHYINLGQRPASVIRHEEFKLIEFLEDGCLELYNLEDDVGEKNNLVEDYPELAADLRKMLHQWRRQVNAQMPSMPVE